MTLRPRTTLDIRQHTSTQDGIRQGLWTRLDSISTSVGEHHNKKLSLEHKYLAIGWSLDTRNREVFQGVDQQWHVVGVMVLKRSALRQLTLFFFFILVHFCSQQLNRNNFYLLLFVRSSLLHARDNCPIAISALAHYIHLSMTHYLHRATSLCYQS